MEREQLAKNKLLNKQRAVPSRDTEETVLRVSFKLMLLVKMIAFIFRKEHLGFGEHRHNLPNELGIDRYNL